MLTKPIPQNSINCSKDAVEKYDNLMELNYFYRRSVYTFLKF